MMTEFVKINGQAVRATSFHRRRVNTEPGGTPVDEIELVVMLRGQSVQRSFQELLRAPRFEIDIPGEGSLQMVLASASLQSSGTGEAAVHRYDVTFREVAEAAARRLAEGGDEPTRAAAVTPAEEPSDADDLDEEDDDGEVDLGGSAVAWAAALRQQTAPRAPAMAPEEPLTPAELAGIESVLVGLRLEALIGELERAGVIRREIVEDAFVNLVSERFVAEATPVVGEAAARRAARSALGG